MRFLAIVALPLLATAAPLARRDAADTAAGFTTDLNTFAAMFLNGASSHMLHADVCSRDRRQGRRPHAPRYLAARPRARPGL